MHKLEEIRIAHKLTKKEMARKLGVTASYYSQIINDYCDVSKRVAIRAHELFGVPLEEILCPHVQKNDTPAVNQ